MKGTCASVVRVSEAHRQKDTMDAGYSEARSEVRQTVRVSARSKQATQLKRSSSIVMVAKAHRMYPWVHVPPGDELEEMKPDDVVDYIGVPKRHVVDYLEKAINEEDHVKSLPGALLLAFFFAILYIYQARMRELNSFETAIDDDIMRRCKFAVTSPGNLGHKNFEDVNSYADFWSWMNTGFMPLFYPENVTTSEQSGIDLGEVPPERQRYYLLYNRGVGPVKLSQELVRSIECRNKPMAEKWGLTCTVPSVPNGDIPPTESELAMVEFTEAADKSVWLDVFREDIDQRLQELETQQWLNERTGHIKVTLMMYNPGLDFLTMTTVHFLFPRSGHIWKKITHKSLILDSYNDIRSFIVTALFYTHVTFLCICEIKEVCLVRCHSDSIAEALRKYASIWNAIDWLVIVCSYVWLAMTMIQELGMRRMQADMIRAVRAGEACTRVDCPSYMENIYSDVEQLNYTFRWLRNITSWFPGLILLRLFKAFKAQQRLAAVTDTLTSAAGPLAHFLIVFFAIFATYAVMGVALFGREMSNFMNLQQAVVELFRAMVGDFDFGAMEPAGRAFAAFFFVSYMCLMVLVMLSMLIAIFMDVYAEVKANMEGATTVFRQVYDTVNRGWECWKGRRLQHTRILHDLREDRLQEMRESNSAAASPSCSDPMCIQEGDLTQQVPGLAEEQAREVLVGAVESYGHQHRPVVPLKEVQLALDHLNDHLLISRDIVLCPDARKVAKIASLESILEAAFIRMESREGMPRWCGGEDMLNHLLGRAQSLHVRCIR